MVIYIDQSAEVTVKNVTSGQTVGHDCTKMEANDFICEQIESSVLSSACTVNVHSGSI